MRVVLSPALRGIGSDTLTGRSPGLRHYSSYSPRLPVRREQWPTCGFCCRLQLRGQRRIRTALPEHLRRIGLSMRSDWSSSLLQRWSPSEA